MMSWGLQDSAPGCRHKYLKKGKYSLNAEFGVSEKTISAARQALVDLYAFPPRQYRGNKSNDAIMI